MTARLSLLALLTVPAFAAGHWDLQYFYDKNDSSLTINDLKFPSEKRGIAAGYIATKKKIDPTVVLTSDSGLHWTLVPVKELPISLFFLDDSIGWMVTEKGLWQTDEAGRTWRKLEKAPKDMLRVCFLDRQHGWLIGEKKQVFETKDGGETWTPLAAAAEPKVNPDYTTYGWIEFGNAHDGIISGWHEPPRRNPTPAWMDPNASKSRRQWPSTFALLQTRDGGKTWDPSIASIFGRVTRISLAPNGESLGLVRFTDSFEWPSEVYFVEPGTGASRRVFRQSDRSITDVLLLPSGTAYIAGVVSTAIIHDNPIPGKLKILRSTTAGEFKTWEDIPVDYRAEAHQAILSAPDEKNIWVATDTGMILKLRE